MRNGTHYFPTRQITRTYIRMGNVLRYYRPCTGECIPIFYNIVHYGICMHGVWKKRRCVLREQNNAWITLYFSSRERNSRAFSRVHELAPRAGMYARFRWRFRRFSTSNDGFRCPLVDPVRTISLRSIRLNLSAADISRLLPIRSRHSPLGLCTKIVPRAAWWSRAQ